MAAKRHIESDNLFDLLHEFGGSIAGAVTLRDHDEPTNFQMTYEPLSDEALSELLLRALRRERPGNHRRQSFYLARVAAKGPSRAL